MNPHTTAAGLLKMIPCAGCHRPTSARAVCCKTCWAALPDEVKLEIVDSRPGSNANLRARAAARMHLRDVYDRAHPLAARVAAARGDELAAARKARRSPWAERT